MKKYSVVYEIYHDDKSEWGEGEGRVMEVEASNEADAIEYVYKYLDEELDVFFEIGGVAGGTIL